MKMGRIIMWNTMYIRHTPVTVEQYLGNQIAKSRTQTPVISWSTNPTNHDISYNSYTHMYLNHGTYTRPSHSDKYTNSNSDKNHRSMDTQMDNVGVNNSNMP